MLTLILLVLFLSVLFLLLYCLKRKDKKQSSEPIKEAEDETHKEDCCGAHEDCDAEKMLLVSNEIVYYDDEELDVLGGCDPSSFTQAQIDQLSDVFYTLKEDDVSGWLISLQKRDIQLPDFLREEAFLIVSERKIH